MSFNRAKSKPPTLEGTSLGDPIYCLDDPWTPRTPWIMTVLEYFFVIWGHLLPCQPDNKYLVLPLDAKCARVAKDAKIMVACMTRSTSGGGRGFNTF